MTFEQEAGHPLGRPTLSWLRMIWKHRRLSGVIFGLLSLTSCVVVYRLPAVYRAEALILVDGQKIPERYVTATVSAELQDRLATISQRILSSNRLQKIIDNFDLYHDDRKVMSQEEIIEKMRADVKVTVEKGWTRDHPGAFRVSYEGKAPTVVAEVSNQIANLFIEENLRARENNAEGTAAFLESELQQAKKNLDQQELKVRQYKTEHNGQLPQQENSLLGNLSRLQLELQGNQDAINRSQQAKMMLESAVNIAEASETSYKQVNQSLQKQRASSGASSPTGVSAGGTTSAGRSRVQQLEQQLELAKQRYTENHPAVAFLQEQLEAAKSIEQKEVKANTANHPSVVAPERDATDVTSVEQAQVNIRERERLSALRNQIEMATRDLDMRNAERQRILGKINMLQGKVETLPLREQEMTALTRDYETSKAHYQSLLDKKMAAEMASNLERRQQSERFTLLDPARVPEKPIKPNRPAISAVCVAVSLVIGLVFGIGREAQRDLMLGEWEMPADVPILGRVPSIAGTPQAKASRTGGMRWRRRPPAQVSLNVGQS